MTGSQYAAGNLRDQCFHQSSVTINFATVSTPFNQKYSANKIFHKHFPTALGNFINIRLLTYHLFIQQSTYAVKKPN